MIRQLYKYLNTSVIYYRRALIIHRKEVINGEIILNVKVIYLIGLNEIITSLDQYQLNEQITFRSVIAGYKELIDGVHEITKK